MKYDAIVLAGGKGTRLNLGYNKVFYQMDNGNTVLENAYANFISDEDCQRVIIAVSDEDRKFLKYASKMVIVKNGTERFDSVFNALMEVKEEYVMIHDGARPYLTMTDIGNLKAGLMQDDACMLGLRSKDTVKEVKDGYVQRTLDRDHIYLAQTPQCFKSIYIKDAYSQAKKSKKHFTDDAAVFEEFYDEKIRMINSTTSNNKITFIDDLR